MKLVILTIITMGIFSFCTKKHVDTLFQNAKTVDNKIFRYDQLDGLPEPVQRYFKYALEDGQPYLNYLRLKHTGTFKTGIDKEWMDIEGQQYFTAQPPGFVWIGKTKQFKALDYYVNNTGNLSVYMFGFLRIVNSKGATIDQAELLRWLGESVWMPTNLLPDENKEWIPIDENTAKITFYWNGQSVYYNVHFNDAGQITKLETERYMEKDRLEKWVGHVGDYHEVDGVKVPGSIKATWLLDKGDHNYARFKVTAFEYGEPDSY